MNGTFLTRSYTLLTRATSRLRIRVSLLRSASGSSYQALTTGIRRMDPSCFRKKRREHNPKHSFRTKR